MVVSRIPAAPRPLPGSMPQQPMTGAEQFHLVDSSDGHITHGPKSPGTRCPTCALEGKEVWVIPGRSCGYCGTPCDGEEPVGHGHHD